jgi:putative heme transporter
MKPPFDRLDYVYKIFVVIALALTGAVLASDVVIPLAFAAFFSVVMLPAVAFLENRKVSTIIAITTVLIAFTFLLLLMGWLIIGQLIALVNDLPDLQTRLDAFLQETSGLMRAWGVSLSDQNSFIKEAAKSVSTYLGNVLVSTTNLVSLVVQIPIYIFLLLLYRDKFKLFFLTLMPTQEEMLWKKDLQAVIRGYVVGLSLVTFIVASLNTVGLALLGIEHAIFFGLLSGLLTIIPYIGIFIGASLPALIALLTKDSAWYALGVVVIFSTVQFLEGNFITPRITGSKVSVNALAAIIALVVGNLLFGIAGMILAVPAIGVLKIILQHSEHLKPFVILLEDTNGSDEPVARGQKTDKENKSDNTSEPAL